MKKKNATPPYTTSPHTKKLKTPLKRFILKKYIMAHSAQEALSKDRITRPDDVWVDEDWKKENPNMLTSAIGFYAPKDYEE